MLVVAPTPFDHELVRRRVVAAKKRVHLDAGTRTTNVIPVDQQHIADRTVMVPVSAVVSR